MEGDIPWVVWVVLFFSYFNLDVERLRTVLNVLILLIPATVSPQLSFRLPLSAVRPQWILRLATPESHTLIFCCKWGVKRVQLQIIDDNLSCYISMPPGDDSPSQSM